MNRSRRAAFEIRVRAQVGRYEADDQVWQAYVNLSNRRSVVMTVFLMLAKSIPAANAMLYHLAKIPFNKSRVCANVFAGATSAL